MKQVLNNLVKSTAEDGEADAEGDADGDNRATYMRAGILSPLSYSLVSSLHCLVHQISSLHCLVPTSTYSTYTTYSTYFYLLYLLLPTYFYLPLPTYLRRHVCGEKWGLGLGPFSNLLTFSNFLKLPRTFPNFHKLFQRFTEIYSSQP